MNNCLFCKMIHGQIQPNTVYEDEQVLAFRDIHPQAPEHILIIPKQHISSLNELADPLLAGNLVITAAKLAKQFGFSEEGYRTVINCNENGGQTVFHLHLHLLGGRALQWPPG